MQSGNYPSGPGTKGPGSPPNEIKDAVKEQEGIDELEAREDGVPADAPAADAAEAARHAARDAHTPVEQGGADTGKAGGSKSSS